MTRLVQASRLLATALLVLGPGGAARAQQQGTYEGQTKNKQPVTIEVGFDSKTGNYTVSSVSFVFVQNCKKHQTYGISVGIGIGGDTDIINGKFSSSEINPYQYIPFKMTFHGTETVKGTVKMTGPAFNPPNYYKTPPKNVQLCYSDEPFTATFSGSGAVKQFPRGTATMRLVKR